MGRSYTEVRERVSRERINNYSEYLPYVETDVATVVNDELLTCLVVKENTEGEITIPNVDRNFERMVCDNICIISSNNIMEKSNNDDCYNCNNKNVSVMVNDWCSRKIRLLYDDGGRYCVVHEHFKYFSLW